MSKQEKKIKSESKGLTIDGFTRMLTDKYVIPWREEKSEEVVNDEAVLKAADEKEEARSKTNERADSANSQEAESVSKIDAIKRRYE